MSCTCIGDITKYGDLLKLHGVCISVVGRAECMSARVVGPGRTGARRTDSACRSSAAQPASPTSTSAPAARRARRARSRATHPWTTIDQANSHFIL